jgi:tRNA(His) 5'-end guanylyltransferase
MESHMRDDLGDRMKGYESESRLYLDKNLPVIGRIDGKAFHSFCRGLDRPWDVGLQHSMWEAAKYAIGQMQGARFAYVQSDEISFLLTAYEKEESQGWFNYRLDKMASVAASLVTGGFIAAGKDWMPERVDEYLDGSGLPAFDARFFNVPQDEVINYFWYRQADAIRNSIQMLARSEFSHKQCDRKSGEQLKQMLLEERGISWDEQAPHNKYGVGIVKKPFDETVTFTKGGVTKTIDVVRQRWVVDDDLPVFYKEVDYLGRFL